MNELAIALLRMGLLLALWILIVSMVLSQGRDLAVGRRNKVRAQAAAPVTATRPAGPAPAVRPTTGGRAAVVAPTTPAPRLARTLRVIEGPLAGRTVELQGRPLLMGRAADADLVLVDDYASGRHARLFPQGTRWFLEDLGSTNGTSVDGATVTRALPVGPDSVIRIGKTVMRLEA